MNPDFYFSYTVDPSADEPIMLIDRHIGMDDEDGMGIMGDLFQKELLVLDGMGKKRIQIWINSPGGLVQDGWNIYNAILRTTTKVDTVCIGMAASIAGVIFQAGRKRIMNDYGILMYHNPFGGDDKSLDAIKDSLIKMIEKRSTMDGAAVQAMMKRTTWISAEEAVQMGLCDEIEHSIEFNKKRAVGTPEEAKAYWSDTRKVLNNVFKTTEKIFDMKKIANKLSLNSEASEDAIVLEIEKTQAKNKSLEEAVAKAELDAKNSAKDHATALAAAEAKAKKAEDDMEDMKAKAKKKEEEEAAAKAAADAAEAKNTVANYVKIGKIKNDAGAIAKAEAIAVKDLAGFKELFGDLPINMVANKIPVTGDSVPLSKLTGVVSNKMHELRSKPQVISELPKK